MSKNHSNKIVLISPPLSMDKQAGSLKDIANVLPTLGIGYIAAVLEKEGFNVKIIDCIGDNLYPDDVLKILLDDPPDIIGFTATILTINAVINMSKMFRKRFPDTIFVIGGPHLTSLPEKTFEKGDFDMGIIGEGEFTLLELAREISKGGMNFKGIKGLVYRDNGNIIVNPPRPFAEDLDSIPFPARHLYPPLIKYKPVPASYKKLPVGLIISSRGCPYQCTFCDRKVFGNKFRAHSPQYVVDEIEELINKHGAREIRFMDDIFTMNKKRTVDICEEILKRGIKIPWTCLARVNAVNPDILKKMKQAGCWQVIYGIESGDQNMLDKMKKGVTVEQNEQAIQWSKEAGLNVRATFVFGFPGETLESIKKTVEFAKKSRLDVVNFFTLVLFPGNELYQVAKREGTVIHEDYDQYTSMVDTENTRLHYIPEGMTEVELKNAIRQAYRDYYFRPSYMIRQLLSIRDIGDINRYWKAFKSITSMKKA